ncbi:hypothetical protein RhiirA4_480122 [Rhizophagus irregularis]|uniref:Uncharacterized protein n=1 Tax=Rhizophagus irregularis TaxID=588596 RepID=A0A2I1HHF6_9GLOM|nr:hypothetical protein RhiirA4_480122 [Rhizophagus irregularis]
MDFGADHSTIAIIRQASRDYLVALLDNQAKWWNSTNLTNLERAEGLAILRSPGVEPSLCLSGRSTCEKQDIKHEGVCESSTNFPPKTFPEKITQIRYVYARSCPVKDAIPTIKKGMETLYKQIPDEIKLCVDNPKELTTELKPDDIISKHFNINHIEEGLILIYPIPKPLQ